MAGGESVAKSALYKIKCTEVFFPAQRQAMNFILIDLSFLFFPFRPDGRVYCNTHDEGVSYGSLCVSTVVHLMYANLFYRME